jgi:hypothetical protein
MGSVVDNTSHPIQVAARLLRPVADLGRSYTPHHNRRTPVAKVPATTIPAERLALYERLVATQPDVERRGVTVPYTSLNGHMFSFLTPTGSLALRLAPKDRATFLVRYGTTLQEAHGTVMKEYVSVPDVLLEDTESLRPWFAASLAFVTSLKPKPSRRKS